MTVIRCHLCDFSRAIVSATQFKWQTKMESFSVQIAFNQSSFYSMEFKCKFISFIEDGTKRSHQNGWLIRFLFAGEGDGW